MNDVIGIRTGGVTSLFDKPVAPAIYPTVDGERVKQVQAGSVISFELVGSMPALGEYFGTVAIWLGDTKVSGDTPLHSYGRPGGRQILVPLDPGLGYRLVVSGYKRLESWPLEVVQPADAIDVVRLGRNLTGTGASVVDLDPKPGMIVVAFHEHNTNFEGYNSGTLFRFRLPGVDGGSDQITRIQYVGNTSPIRGNVAARLSPVGEGYRNLSNDYAFGDNDRVADVMMILAGDQVRHIRQIGSTVYETLNATVESGGQYIPRDMGYTIGTVFADPPLISSGFFARFVDGNVLAGMTPEQIMAEVTNGDTRRGDLSKIRAVMGGEGHIELKSLEDWETGLGGRLTVNGDVSLVERVTANGGSAAATGFRTTSHSPSQILDGTYFHEFTGSEEFFQNPAPSRVGISVARPSVVEGEGVYAAITGLTDEERANWHFGWDFGEGAEYKWLDSLPAHLRSSRRAIGHHQVHCYNTPGTKTIRVKVIPPLYTKIAAFVLTVEVEVQSADEYFEGCTFYVDPLGEWPGSKPGWYNIRSQDERSPGDKGQFHRTLFRRGLTYDTAEWPSALSLGLYRGGGGGGVMIGAGPGTEAMPLFLVRKGKGFSSRNGNYHAPFVIIKDLDFLGDFDVQLGNVEDSESIFDVCELGNWTIQGSRFVNVRTAVNAVPGHQGFKSDFVFFDNYVTGWSFYGIWIEGLDFTRQLNRGCYIAQDPLAPAVNDGKSNPLQNPDYPDHGPYRTPQTIDSDFLFSTMELRSIHSWIGGSKATDGSGRTPSAFQAQLRLGTSNCPNINALINECYSEGGGWSIGSPADGGKKGGGFCAMYHNYHVPAANWCQWSIELGGSWVRDNVIAMPDVMREDENGATWAPIKAPGSSESSEDPTFAEKPIHIYNNTVVWLLSPENVVGTVQYSDLMGSGSHAKSATAPEVNEYNNVLWAPNYPIEEVVDEEAGEQPRWLVPTGMSAQGPWGPTPTYRGEHYLSPATGELVLRTETATPADANVVPFISADSNLRNGSEAALNGRRIAGALDFYGRLRPGNLAEIDRGAVQYSVMGV